MQSPKCTIVLVYPHAEKVPSPTSLLLQYVRCASNHHYDGGFVSVARARVLRRPALRVF